MSKPSSGLYAGTKGDLQDSNDIISYIDWEALKNHMERPDPSTSMKKGIKGAHNKNYFMKEIKRTGAQIVNSIQHPKMKGIETITYQMPKLNLTGEPNGTFRSKIFAKTVYDPAVLSTKAYIRRGLEAANQAIQNAPSHRLSREWTGIDHHGIQWRGYVDSHGHITSFYPEE